MAAIALFHTGTAIPPHLNDCVRSIRKRSADVPVYLLTDQLASGPADTVQVRSVLASEFADLQKLENPDYFSRGSLAAMWRGACFRLFYLHRLLELEQLQDVLHFDNDVMLFTDPNEIASKAAQVHKRCAITPLCSNEVCFGMSYIPNAQALKPIVDYIAGVLQEPWETLVKRYDGYPNEMRLLAECKELEYLPIVPYGTASRRYTNNQAHFDGIFDPASYGQFLGGTFNEKQPGWFGKHQTPGKLIGEGKIQVLRDNNGQPWVMHDRTRYKVHNLHIHSKNTQAFL